MRWRCRGAGQDLALKVSGTVSAIAGAGSVGDAASLELSREAGRAIWDIRRGMIEDREKLEYLQERPGSLAITAETPPSN